MIPGRIEDIGTDALEALIANEVREGKTIEYKQEIPGRADSDVVPFLATVTSLANTAGGDLLLGVKASKGVPVELSGVQIGDVDGEKLRLEHMLLNGVEPRLPRVDIQEIEVAEDTYVLVIRAASSWSAPHRVNKNSKFYARHSTGRYELDVGELRDAFAMSESIPERIRGFRADRIGKIQSRETPVPLVEGGCMVTHVIPLSVVRSTSMIDIAALNAHGNQIRPIETPAGWGARINLDGIVTCTMQPPNQSYAYTQMFRSGAAENLVVLDRHEGQTLVRSAEFEHQVAGFVGQYLNVAADLEIEPPYYTFLSFLGVRGCEFALHRGIRWSPHERMLTEDRMILPEVMIDDRNDEPFKVLRPAFDFVWNAFGLIGSLNYDDQGNWLGR